MLDNQSPELFGQTPWQTVGPFFHYALTWHGGADLVGSSRLGSRKELFAPEYDGLAQPRARQAVNAPTIRVGGRVLDGAGQPVPDVMIETWQADAAGRYPTDTADGFPGFGRTASGEDGAWHILTIRPGTTQAAAGAQAPHIAIGIFGRGLLKRLVTRAYFADAAENVGDPVLSLVPEDRRHTLLARAGAEGWIFDIHLQGENETVFFDV